MGGASQRRRLSDAVVAINRFSSSRRLDLLLAARSRVPLRTAAIGVLGRIVRDGPIGLKELARLTRMQPAGVSRQVQVLETGGYVSRAPDPHDGRVSVVRATARGRFAYQRVWEAIDELMSVQLEEWTDDELDQASAILERLEHDFRTVRRQRDHVASGGQ
ncbi:MAG TPA: MarR family transcriptional regulator [Acidimicrobiales bacterium]|nr:MarR family transcriptional regulator [Acidimicrobiales bacterium]